MFGSNLIEDRGINPKQKGPAIVPFITAGYPNKDDYRMLFLLVLVEALTQLVFFMPF
jgi:tryptophan synthase alpha subunit